MHKHTNTTHCHEGICKCRWLSPSFESFSEAHRSDAEGTNLAIRTISLSLNSFFHSCASDLSSIRSVRLPDGQMFCYPVFDAHQAYRKAYDEMVQKRNAIGENDQEALVINCP